MGRVAGLGKHTTDDYSKTLTIKFLKKFGYLDNGKLEQTGALYWTRNGNANGNIGFQITIGESSGIIRVYFNQTDREGNKKELDYNIKLTSTKCHYGGVRRWFLCPCKGNRCSILYLQNNGIFASRKTLDLCYDDQKRPHSRREFNRVFPKDNEAEKIYKTIKYKYRNGKPTRKYKRYLKLSKDDIPLDELDRKIKALLLR